VLTWLKSGGPGGKVNLVHSESTAENLRDGNKSPSATEDQLQKLGHTDKDLYLAKTPCQLHRREL
jgi:hypothetical protein